MPQDQVFEITQYELHISRYRTTAATEAVAIQQLLSGGRQLVYPISGSRVLIEPDETRGMSATEHGMLALELQELEICVEKVIPSIQAIRVVPQDELDREDLDAITGR